MHRFQNEPTPNLVTEGAPSLPQVIRSHASPPRPVAKATNSTATASSTARPLSQHHVVCIPLRSFTILFLRSRLYLAPSMEVQMLSHANGHQLGLFFFGFSGSRLHDHASTFSDYLSVSYLIALLLSRPMLLVRVRLRKSHLLKRSL